MPKMDVDYLRYIEAEELRVLCAVEQGQRNHEVVPVSLISSLASIKHGVRSC